jgi:hypothetical protein
MDVKIGLQLYSLRQSLASDPWGTFVKIAEAGFTRLEAATSPSENIDEALFVERKRSALVR